MYTRDEWNGEIGIFEDKNACLFFQYNIIIVDKENDWFFVRYKNI